MNQKQKNMLIRIIASAIIYIAASITVKMNILVNMPKPWTNFVLFLIPYMIIGWDIVYKAIRGIKNGQVFDENFLMTVATFGAFGVGEFSEAVAVMLFYQIGELFQSYAVNRSRQSISDLMNICPEYANIEKDGKLEQVDPDDVEVDDIIVVQPGERIPLDGVVVEGESMIDTSALTGEAVPRHATAGDEIVSGCVNGSGLLHVRVTKEFDDSTVARILELVENASSKKAKVENFITRFAKYYTPSVVAAAVILAFIPPIVLGGGFGEWIQRACIFLVISCPCALVISVPLSFFGGIGAASRIGVLVKGSNFIEAVSELDTVVFDKTGTLTKGEFKVTELHPLGISEDELLELAAYAENYSTHPIAESIREAYLERKGNPKKKGNIDVSEDDTKEASTRDALIDLKRIGETKEISGHGIRTLIDGHEVLAGNGRLMKSENIAYQECDGIGTVIYLAKDGKFAGSILIADSIKPETKEAIRGLKSAGIRRTVMLTGDRKAVGEAVAKEIGIDQAYTELLPADKVNKVEEMLAGMNEKNKLAFVGDGINDAPVLSRADVGIAMGSMGSDAAIEAADIVLMDDNPAKIASVVKIGRKTMTIVRQNIVFALAVKAIVLLMGAAGVANMWEAVFADVGVSVIAILNAMRALRTK